MPIELERFVSGVVDVAKIYLLENVGHIEGKALQG